MIAPPPVTISKVVTCSEYPSGPRIDTLKCSFKLPTKPVMFMKIARTAYVPAFGPMAGSMRSVGLMAPLPKKDDDLRSELQTLKQLVSTLATAVEKMGDVKQGLRPPNQTQHAVHDDPKALFTGVVKMMEGEIIMIL